MATTYCTSLQVAARIGQTTDFSGSTNPTDTTVDEMINDNEDFIDHETMHAWRATTVTDEMHHLETPAYSRREGIQIFLNHRIITTFASGTDKLEIWDGSTFLDYVANKTEGRNNDFWVDYTTGIIHIKTFPRTLPRWFSARVTYRYGESSVVNDIRKACILLTAADIADLDDRSVLIPEGTSNIPIEVKASRWRGIANGIISNHKEAKVLTF